MQLLEDNNIIESGDMANRIAVLRNKVQQLLENQASTDTPVASSKFNEDLVDEIAMLKKQLSQKGDVKNSEEFKKLLIENDLLKSNSDKFDVKNSEEYKKLLEEKIELTKQLENTGDKLDKTVIKSLKAKVAALKIELDSKVVNSEGEANDDIIQENIMLKKIIENREKTIKELDFKLEMFRLAKSLRQGAGIDTKSEELKKIITEYIKEIDTSIASLNIK